MINKGFPCSDSGKKKNLPASAEDVVDVCSISGLGRYLELEMAVLSSVLVWRIT